MSKNKKDVVETGAEETVLADNAVETEKEGSKKKGKKHFESKFKPAALREAIQEGCNATEIMDRLEIGHMQTLRQYVLKLMDQDKTFYEVQGLYKHSVRRPMSNFKQDIVIRKKMLENLGLEFKHGDEFDMEVVDGKIILSLVENAE